MTKEDTSTKPESEAATTDTTETVTVEQLQAKIAELEADRDKWKSFSRKNEDEAKAAKAQIDDGKTDAQRLQDQLNSMQSDLAEQRAERLRYEIATEMGIPKDAADKWLTAADEDDLRSQAADLAELLQAKAKASEGPRAPGETTIQEPPALNSDRLQDSLARAVGAR